MTIETMRARRACCPACGRPEPACWCALVRPLATPVELLILQHPLEAGVSKGTGRLLHRCLPNSQLWVGEHFDAAELEARLQAGGRTPLLLYPGAGAAAPDGPAAALRLVVLDATWRKSRKMLHLNPLLQRLPRLALAAVPGAYTIRKAQLPDQLSTLEAAAHALQRLGTPAAPLLDCFAAFVAREAQAIAAHRSRARLNPG